MLRPGNTILIDDGLIELKVQEVVNGTDIVCTVVNGGELGMRKGVNVPNVKIKLPALTEKDKADIRFGIEQGLRFHRSFLRSYRRCSPRNPRYVRRGWFHHPDHRKDRERRGYRESG